MTREKKGDMMLIEKAEVVGLVDGWGVDGLVCTVWDGSVVLLLRAGDGWFLWDLRSAGTEPRFARWPKSPRALCRHRLLYELIKDTIYSNNVSFGMVARCRCAQAPGKVLEK